MVLVIFPMVLTPSPYQHFCGGCPVHVGIHVVVVVLYKLVIPVGIILGHTGTNKGISWKIFLYKTIFFNICITLKRKYTYILSNLGKRIGGMGDWIIVFNSDIYLCSRTNFCRNQIWKKSKSILLSMAFLLSNWFYFPWIWRELCYMFHYWVSIRSGTSWEASHHSTKNKLRNFHFRYVLQ